MGQCTGIITDNGLWGHLVSNNYSLKKYYINVCAFDGDGVTMTPISQPPSIPGHM